jgi:hypothetical protein
VSQGDLFEIFDALGDAHVRYLVVGGVAVVLHGHPRFTADLDLVVALDRDNVLTTMKALDGLGYRPRAPVPAADFADPAIRRTWVEEKGLTVFSLWSQRFPATEIDLFVEEPFSFEEAYLRGVHVSLGRTEVVVAAIDDLVALKRRAGRPRDLEDVDALEAIARESK